MNCTERLPLETSTFRDSETSSDDESSAKTTLPKEQAKLLYDTLRTACSFLEPELQEAHLSGQDVPEALKVFLLASKQHSGTQSASCPISVQWSLENACSRANFQRLPSGR
jgi:hypothetical protein